MPPIVPSKPARTRDRARATAGSIRLNARGPYGRAVRGKTSLQGKIVGVRIHWPGSRHRRRAEKLQLQRLNYLACNVVLYGEDVVERAIIALRPEVRTVGGPDELRGDSQLLAGLPHAALQDVHDVELLADRTQVFVTSLELERRSAPDHAQLGQLRQQVEQLLRKAVREVFLVLARAHVRERQHRDRLVVGRGWRNR